MTLTYKFTNALTRIANHLLPTQCLLCDSPLHGELICAGCECDLPHLYNQQHCKQCSIIIESHADFCGHCLQHPPAFNITHIPFAYEYPLNLLIHQFKYRQRLTHGKLLGSLLANYLRHCAGSHADWQWPDIIIPTPMHWAKRWQRGFNQADVIAQYIANALQLPLATRIIKRTQKTAPQKELTRTERQKNLRHAFVIPHKNSARIQGKRIAIIDDVVTTTATMRALSSTLINAGAIDVQVWALARTMPLT